MTSVLTVIGAMVLSVVIYVGLTSIGRLYDKINYIRKQKGLK